MKTQLASVLLLASTLRLCAWDGPGHMLVAKIAYDNVNAHARAKLDSLPAKIVSNGHPMNAINVATWADEIKHANPQQEHFAGDFAPWHFINLPIDPNSPQPPDLLAHPPQVTLHSGTIVEALQLCEAVIHQHQHNALVPNEQVALALLIHFVGDIHQPLHCGAHYYHLVPGGGKTNDLGGNAVAIVNFQNLYPELHQLWDTGFKLDYNSQKNVVTAEPDWNPVSITTTSPQLVAMETTILAEKPTTPITLSGDYYSAWALESEGLAKDVAYGALPPSVFSPNTKIQVNDAYVETVKKTARQRLCLAGLRLAAVLNKLYP